MGWMDIQYPVFSFYGDLTRTTPRHGTIVLLSTPIRPTKGYPELLHPHTEIVRMGSLHVRPM